MNDVLRNLTAIAAEHGFEVEITTSARELRDEIARQRKDAGATTLALAERAIRSVPLHGARWSPQPRSAKNYRAAVLAAIAALAASDEAR